MHISVIFYKTRLLFLCISYVFFFIPTIWLLLFYNCCHTISCTINLFLDLLLIFRLFLFFDFILLFSIVLSSLFQHLYLTNKRTIFPLPDLSFYDRITLIQRLYNLAIAFFLTRTEVRTIYETRQPTTDQRPQYEAALRFYLQHSRNLPGRACQTDKIKQNHGLHSGRRTDWKSIYPGQRDRGIHRSRPTAEQPPHPPEQSLDRCV